MIELAVVFVSILKSIPGRTDILNGIVFLKTISVGSELTQWAINWEQFNS